jgi:cytosine/adenosine deaminase-related metal-dependent hydrolase
MRQVDLVIKNGIVLTQNSDDTILSDGGIAVTGGKIVAVGDSGEKGGYPRVRKYTLSFYPEFHEGNQRRL